MYIPQPGVVRDEMLEDGVERECADLRLLVLQRAQIAVLHGQIFFPAMCGHRIRWFDPLHIEAFFYEQLAQPALARAIIHDETFRVITFQHTGDTLIVCSRRHATTICIGLIMSGNGILGSVRSCQLSSTW